MAKKEVKSPAAPRVVKNHLGETPMAFLTKEERLKILKESKKKKD